MIILLVHLTTILYKVNISASDMLSDEERLTVVNVVASTRVAEELDLPDIAIQLNCEYEPEQFPGVIYRVVDPKLAILASRSEEHTSESSHTVISYAVFCLKKKNKINSSSVIF